MYPNKTKETTIPKILLVIGAILIILGVTLYFLQRVPTNYIKTTGTVTSVKSENVPLPGKENQYVLTYYPVISFTVHGNDYQFAGNGQTYAPYPSPIGQLMSVSYNPSNPQKDPHLANDRGPFIVLVILTGLGILISIVSLIIFLVAPKSRS